MKGGFNGNQKLLELIHKDGEMPFCHIKKYGSVFGKGRE
jgi:hypothetical protein